jgi:hypothetical protein
MVSSRVFEFSMKNYHILTPQQANSAIQHHVVEQRVHYVEHNFPETECTYQILRECCGCRRLSHDGLGCLLHQ